jgi:hypothetical protein
MSSEYSGDSVFNFSKLLMILLVFSSMIMDPSLVYNQFTINQNIFR